MTGSGPRMLAWLALASTLPMQAGVADARQATATSEIPSFALAYWQAMPGPMALPVFDAAVAAVGDTVVVLGGVTETMTATRAIQLRVPIHGWQPVGSNLLEDRANPSCTPLGHGRYLVLGGWSGTWGHDAVPRADGEVLAPLIAGTSRAVTPWHESLEGHSATRLPDGRVAVACGCAVRVFDPLVDDWTLEVELVRERRHQAAAMVGWNLVLVGGDAEGTVESVWFGAPEPASSLWDERLASPLSESSAIALDERFALCVGGADPETRTTTPATFVLDTARRAIRPSARLSDARGACDVTLCVHPRGIIALGGEWRTGAERGAADTALLLRPLASPPAPRQWALPRIPVSADHSRRLVLSHPDGTIELLGGYRFVGPEDAVDGDDAGVVVDASNQRLVVDVTGTAD